MCSASSRRWAVQYGRLRDWKVLAWFWLSFVMIYCSISGLFWILLVLDIGFGLVLLVFVAIYCCMRYIVLVLDVQYIAGSQYTWSPPRCPPTAAVDHVLEAATGSRVAVHPRA